MDQIDAAFSFWLKDNMCFEPPSLYLMHQKEKLVTTSREYFNCCFVWLLRSDVQRIISGNFMCLCDSKSCSISRDSLWPFGGCSSLSRSEVVRWLKAATDMPSRFTSGSFFDQVTWFRSHWSVGYITQLDYVTRGSFRCFWCHFFNFLLVPKLSNERRPRWKTCLASVLGRFWPNHLEKIKVGSRLTYRIARFHDFSSWWGRTVRSEVWICYFLGLKIKFVTKTCIFPK